MSLAVLGTIATTIAPWLGEWAIVGLAGKLGEGAVKHFKPDEMALLLKQSIATAEAKQPPTGALFDRCHQDGYKGVKKFLEQFFLSGEVLKELQKPLQDKGKPDLAILIAAFKQSAKQHPEAKQYLLNSLPLWMETFVESYFEQIKGICFQVAKAQYLEQLARRVDDVKFVGIAVPGEEVEKQEVLAQIFVMPDVREEKNRNLWQFSSPEIKFRSIWNSVDNSFETFAAVKSERQNTLREEQKVWAMRDRSAPRIPAQKVINLAQKKAVILGAPGSGKTMLASYFALMLCETTQSDPTQIGLKKDADYLPLVVRIRDWISEKNMSLLEYLRWDAKKNSHTKELPTGFFEHWLERGKALILLDGLDEVVDEAQRRKVAEQIETFLHQYQDNPAVITSRPAGYRWDFFNLDEFPHYTLESFDDKQVATFIDHWYDSRLKEDPAQADRRKADLQKAFARNERIRLLAKNPLLLTIITLIHRYQAELPRQRCKLYEKAVETLLTSWDSGKEIKLYSQVLLFLKSDDLLYILKKLAYWIHTQGSTGETEGGTLIDKEELIRWLRKEIQTLKKCEAHEAKGEAERFIDFIQRRTGLLNEQGRDRYAFVHKTFQEYLTAEEIFDRADVEDDTEIILDHFRQHLHDQHWREVLLLLVSKLKGKKAQKAIQAVLDAGSEYEQWLHRDLLFAGWCLTEDPPELTVVAADLVGGILDRLVGLEIEDVDLIGKKIRGELAEILHCFIETTVEQTVWERLQAQRERIDCFRLLEFQAYFGQEVEAIGAFLTQLRDLYSFPPSRTASALGKLENTDLVSGLLSLLNDENLGVRSHAVSALGYLGSDSPDVVSGLLSLISDKSWSVRWNVTLALANVRNTSLDVMNGLLYLLESEEGEDEDICYVALSAARTLGNIYKKNSEVVSRLISLLEDEKSITRLGSAAALCRIGNTNSEVIGVLLSLLKDEKDDVRLGAIESIAILGNITPSIFTGLLSLLEDKDCNIRFYATESIGRLGNAAPEAVNSLLSLIHDEDLSVRYSAAAALIRLGNATPEVVSGLLSLLNDRKFYLRSRVVITLGELENTSQQIMNNLLFLLGDKESNVRDGAASALNKLAKKSDIIRPKVVQWLEQNPNDDGIGSAIDCLWSIVVE
jgi:HEAT repeat protein